MNISEVEVIKELNALGIDLKFEDSNIVLSKNEETMASVELPDKVLNLVTIIKEMCRDGIVTYQDEDFSHSQIFLKAFRDILNSID